MKATALVCSGKQAFSLDPVILPELNETSVAIRTHFSGVSVGTEFALVRNKISWGPYPICTGYMAVGEITDAGSKSGFKPGDRVYYRDNRKMVSEQGGAVSAVAGTHCSHAVVDVANTEGMALLPEGVAEAAASMFVLPAVGLNGVNQAGPGLGQSALVFGCGPIGLGVIIGLAQRGCRIVAVDLDDLHLKAARRLGADVALNSKSASYEADVRAQAPDGYDYVFECTGHSAFLKPTMQLCKRRGDFVWQGNYGEAAFPFEFMVPHMGQLTMHFPCNDGVAPCRAAVLKLMALGMLPWNEVVTHRVPAVEAPAFFDRINKGQVDGLLGAVVDWRSL